MKTNYSEVDSVATGRRIRELRKAKGLKVSDLAEYMGFTTDQAIYKWQRGEAMPEIGNLAKLMELFGVERIKDILVMTGGAEEASPFDYCFSLDFE